MQSDWFAFTFSLTWTRWFSSIFIFNGIYYNFSSQGRESSSLAMAFNWLDFLLINNYRDKNIFSRQTYQGGVSCYCDELRFYQWGINGEIENISNFVHFRNNLFIDVCRWYFLWSVLGWSSFEASSKYDLRISLTTGGVARNVVISFATDYYLISKMNCKYSWIPFYTFIEWAMLDHKWQRKSGDLIHFSRMPKLSHFRGWLFPIIIYGCTGARR